MRKLINIRQKNQYSPTSSKKKKSARATRKKPAPKWLKPTITTISIFSVIAAVFGGPLWLLRSGVISRGLDSIWKETVIQTADLGLRVDQALT